MGCKMELDDLLNKIKQPIDSSTSSLTPKLQKQLLTQAICEITNKPGKEVEVFLRFKSKSDIKQLLKDDKIGSVYNRIVRDYQESLKGESVVQISNHMQEVEVWRVVATIESYNNQVCSNCNSNNTSYVGTFQILQHKKYWDRRNLVRLDEQVAAIHESKVFKTEQTVLACSSCRKFIDSSNLIKEYGSLFGSVSNFN